MSYSLLVFIVVTSFLVLKIFANLSSKNHKQVQVSSNNGTVVPLGAASQSRLIVQYPVSAVDFDTATWQDALSRIQKWDDNFTWGMFAYQVQWLHDKVLQSFANADIGQLGLYLKNNDLLESLNKKIKAQVEQNLTQHTETIFSQVKEIRSVAFDSSKVVIDVHIFDKFISFVQDSNYKLIEGSKNIQAQNWIWTICGTVETNTADTSKCIEWSVLNIQRT